MSTPTEHCRTLVILGKELRVRADESPEHLDALVQHVEACAAEICRGRTPALDVQVLLATALELADQVFKLKREQADLIDRLRSSSRSILGRLGTPQASP